LKDYALTFFASYTRHAAMGRSYFFLTQARQYYFFASTLIACVEGPVISKLRKHIAVAVKIYKKVL
jgi:hypothetical protein